jgi:hypothetical protein
MAFPILGALKLAMNAGSHIYKKKKETQMMMANAQAKHAEKMASGELEYSGKLLEARQSDWKDEFVFGRINAANFGDCVRGLLGRSGRFCQDKRVLRSVPAAPVMVHKFVDPCRCEYLWYKGNTNI